MSKYPLEPTPDQMRAMADAAVARVIEHIESLPDRPASNLDGSLEVARSAVEKLPEHGADFDDLLSMVFDDLTPTSFCNAGPGFLAYIPGGGIYDSALADLVANAINRYVTVWAAAPGLVQLEVNVVRWFCEMLGYPESASGFLSSGGSLANFSAVFTARRERLPENFLSGTIYASTQVHHSLQRAATLAGFPESAVRKVVVDSQWRIDLDDLRGQIRADRVDGKTPFLVVGSAGTTNTGAVDDLAGLADLAAEENLWLHVDAAYGGFFALTERGRKIFSGIDRADSLTLDPHKGLFLPYGTGCLLARDGATLKRAHSIHADYMPPMQEAEGLVDFCNISPELSRDFRGLRVWLPLRHYGFGAFRHALDEKLDLTDWVHRELEKIDGIEIVAAPQLSIVAFRLAPPGIDLEETNRLNRELLKRINDRKRVLLTETVLDGKFVLRVCVLSFRTHRDRMEMCLDDIHAAVDDFLGDARRDERRDST